MSESAPGSSTSSVGNGNGNGNGNGRPTREHTCPICATTFPYREWTDVPTFPFCSLRCKQQDLGAWLTDGYAIKTSMLTGEHEAGPADDDEPDDSDDSDEYRDGESSESSD